jgi:hypothetical protein
MINVELVPPNPNELDRKELISFLVVFEAIFSFEVNSSGSSKLILGATKEFSIIKIE